MTLLVLALACNADKTPIDDSDDVVVPDDTDPQTDDSDEPVDTGPFDNDGDGYVAQEDCDDNDVGVHPDANEFCDGIDQDCDGAIDEGAIDGTWFYPDADGDTYGTVEGKVKLCEEELDGYMSGGTGQWDCDDEDEAVNPGAEEVCGNGVDDDCDGQPAEGCRMEGTLTSADAIFRGAEGDLVGHGIAAGDFNGDGSNDLAISGWSSVDSDGVAVGRVYIANGPFSGEFDLPTESAANVSAEAADIGDHSRIGDQVVSGDFDSDGYDDLLIGAPLGDFEDSSSGAVFLHHGPFTGEVALDSVSAIYGLARDDGLGQVVVTGVDVNGDTQDDLVLGGTGGEAIWVLDRIPTETETVDVAVATIRSGDGGTQLFGRFADAHGDTNGDGIEDLAVSAPWAGADGSAWVVLGPLSGDIECNTDGLLIEAGTDVNGLGYGAVSNGGDVNDDGYDDLLLTNYQTGGWLFLGPITSTRATGEADARFESSAASDYFGERGSGLIDDLDLDGNDEIQMGRPQIGGGGPGYLHVWYGPVSGNQSPSDAELILVGENTSDWFGYEAHQAADVNDNGLPDLLVGAQNAGTGNAGAAYLFFNSAY